MGQSRVLNVARTLAITGVSIINGHVTSSSGGGIVNSGQLTLTDCMISNNTATYLAVGGRGGGIFNSGLLSLTRVSVTSNFASELGGGIYSSGFLTMTQSVLAGNPGGGLYNETSGNASIERTTITGNSGYLGGGISNGGTLFISNSTLAENSAKKDGGAIFSNNSAKIYNTTIAYNEADSDADGVGDGAGIFNASGSTFNIRNSVIAGNYLAGQQDYQDCFGTFGIFGNNQLSDGSGCLAGVGSPGTATLIGSVYELGILNDNGGPTRTVALIAPSSLIGGAVGCVDQNNVQLATDQRGRSRPPTGNRCDIGAYEYNDIFANGF